ncbi:chromosome segregation protein SMC [Breoghania sp. L-A4]|uniref:chromosome segregation protein SMC n=1 Tax=Breoghania sp. L-A4 TaxID=2304600 RepID=UPI000E358670|nr:chromosome segregation protein SMC [Breoghania sp. L-A4]AXS42451.1 chromosome segregation protein SMC [Breoghania sp. L-A4]
MKFSKLRLLGFKSFVEPTEFHIRDGLTGVVGPNGCGKSNLVEAMRWVMGENSYKNMRASGMDDVIFSGSLNRPARNTAEVTLFLDNSERKAPAGFNDDDALEISRRIEREAGSAYKINAKDVRARDVQLLFADASTGARSPALVGQGRIGELIAAKPTARRQILEEAAGISGLHSRRHEAELRLRAAETNLERLEDVLVQIDGQLEGLKRQARQASRYRNLSADIRQAEAAILYLRWQEAQGAMAQAQTQLGEALSRVNEVASAQAQTAKDQAIAAHQVPQLRDASARAGAALQRLVLARNELDAEDRRIRERLRDLEQRRNQLAQDLEREERMGAENVELLAALDVEEAQLKQENESVQARTGEVEAKLEEAQGRLADSEARLAEKTEENAGLSAQRNQLQRAVGELAGRVERFKQQAGEIVRELEAVRERISSAHDVEEKRAGLEAMEEALAMAEERVDVAEAATRAAREAEQSARGPLTDAERRLSGLQSEAKALKSILDVASGGQWPPAVDSVSVATGFEAALGAAFGEDLDAPLSSEAPVHWGAEHPGADDPTLPDGVEALADHVDAPAALRRRLRQIGLVDRADGPRLQALLKPGQRLVAREGDLWRWDGFTVAAEAPTPAAQRLAQRNRLIEIEDRIQAMAGEVEDCRVALENAQGAVRVASEAEQATRGEVREAQRRVSDARNALAEVERAVAQLIARQGALEDSQQRILPELEEAGEALAEARAALEAIPDASGLEDAIARMRGAVAEERAAVSEIRATRDGLSREHEMRQRRVEAIARERKSWIERAANAERHLSVLRERQEEAAEEIAALQEAPGDIEEKRRALIGEIAKAEDARVEADDALAVAETLLRDADRAAKDALEGLSSAREGKVRAEERAEAAKARMADVEARIEEALEVPPGALREIAGLKEGAPLPDLDASERRLERYRVERERLGGVNLRAEDEMTEVSEQREALITDRDDLIEAIRRLRTGIANLNREARERLLASFEVVNEHFQRLFTHLFGGGMAELQLVDSDDPLEAGLEIVARPPGKKPQTMTLLSGGEQALTAMALIFAVFLTNPAPICVLDEVDAPLDDANVERYCDLLDEMAKLTDTRFVVITHNPITMARMNRLYGVTMAERGVSQLVSVDLEVAERILDAV